MDTETDRTVTINFDAGTGPVPSAPAFSRIPVHKANRSSTGFPYCECDLDALRSRRNPHIAESAMCGAPG